MMHVAGPTAPATDRLGIVGELSSDCRVILLLCGHFAVKPGSTKPLTPAEYHALADWLDRQQLKPSALLGRSAARKLDAYAHDGNLPGRVHRLLEREPELETALLRWAHAGIWVVGERDGDYPGRLRKRLRSGSFPLLFGVGPRDWLNDGGLCVAGSRDCPEAARQFARRLGKRCASEAITVISSDMRGADREATMATLAAGGRVICVLSDSLEKAAVARRNRDALAAGRLSLVTPFAPSTRFSVSNAMRANKYPYSLSDVAVVVESRRTGGIWSGADENRREGWVPGFVRVDENTSPGNRALLHLGLSPISLKDVEDSADLRGFFARQSGQRRPPDSIAGDRPDLYGVFAAGLQELLITGPHTESEIMQHFGIERVQARKWLQRAVVEHALLRTGRPARYALPPN